jgi:hypothetical protein
MLSGQVDFCVITLEFSVVSRVGPFERFLGVEFGNFGAVLTLELSAVKASVRIAVAFAVMVYLAFDREVERLVAGVTEELS